MAVLEQLIELQALDNEITRLQHRLTHLPEAETFGAAQDRASVLIADSETALAESRSIAALVESTETAVAELRRQMDRLSGQLRTVIAPREAEALQHEIAVLNGRISDLEESALEAIERSDAVDVRIARLTTEIAGARAEVAHAAEALEAAQHDVLASIEEGKTQRAQVAATIDPGWVARYDGHRASHGGIAVARLERGRCGGCHLDLSTSEVEALRRLGPDERECPNCARWLVV